VEVVPSLTAGCGAGDVEVDAEVYSSLVSSRLFSRMSLDVDEVNLFDFLAFLICVPSCAAAEQSRLNMEQQFEFHLWDTKFHQQI